MSTANPVTTIFRQRGNPYLTRAGVGMSLRSAQTVSGPKFQTFFSAKEATCMGCKGSEVRILSPRPNYRDSRSNPKTPKSRLDNYLWEGGPSGLPFAVRTTGGGMALWGDAPLYPPTLSFFGGKVPRINIDDEVRADPRFHALCSMVPRNIAWGALVCLWELGQAYWKKDKQLIPRTLFEQTPNSAELLRVGLVVEKSEGIYCAGSEERWGFLLAKSEAGKRSAEVRKARFGTAQPPGGKQEWKIRTEFEQRSNGIEPSSSSSSSSKYILPPSAKELVREKSQKKPKKPTNPHFQPALTAFLEKWGAAKGVPYAGVKAGLKSFSLFMEWAEKAANGTPPVEFAVKIIDAYLADPKWRELGNHSISALERNAAQYITRQSNRFPTKAAFA